MREILRKFVSCLLLLDVFVPLHALEIRNLKTREKNSERQEALTWAVKRNTILKQRSRAEWGWGGAFKRVKMEQGFERLFVFSWNTTKVVKKMRISKFNFRKSIHHSKWALNVPISVLGIVVLILSTKWQVLSSHMSLLNQMWTADDPTKFMFSFQRHQISC